MRYQINEMFFSIQGEGYNTGMPAIFIRFAGCNLKCPFCDTDHNKRMELNIDDILLRIRPYFCLNIILTGGEPTEQDIFPLTKSLKETGYKIFLETNGTNIIDNFYIDWITISPKNLNFKLKEANEMKLVYIKQDIREYYLRSNCKYYYLQPCHGLDNTLTVVDLVKKNCNKWRLSLQCQKMINIR